MKKHRAALIGLLVFVTASAVLTAMVLATLRREVAGPTNSYSAVFTDVSGMAPGNDVRVAGVRVGRVDAVDLDGAAAKVTFRVDRHQRLYTDTVASVTYQNIIGQRYLRLSPGSDSKHTSLADHGQIPREHTNPSLDISYVLNGFEPLFTQLDPQQVDNLTTAIVAALQGDSGSIVALTAQTSALAQTLAGPDQVLGDLIGNLDAVVNSLSAQNANLQTVIGDTRQVLSGFAARRSDLVASVGAIDATTSRLAAITNEITPDLRSFIERQPGFLSYSLRDGRPRLAYLAANIPFLLKGLARSTQEGSYLDVYACDLDFSLWRGLFHWVRAQVASATPGDYVTPGYLNKVKHSSMCR